MQQDQTTQIKTTAYTLTSIRRISGYSVRTEFSEARRTTLDPGLRRDDGLNKIPSLHIEADVEVHAPTKPKQIERDSEPQPRCRRRAASTARPKASRTQGKAAGEPDRKSASAQPLNRAEKWIRKEAGA